MLREELERLKSINNPNVKVGVIETLYAVKDGAAGMRRALERICSEADKAIAAGCTILVLSDRNSDAEHSYVPPLLCVGGLHHYLIRNRNRGQASIVVDSGEPREVQDFVTLFGYGASGSLSLLSSGDST